mmetsp:Transcript_18042/g.63360  ORF Transcript_18042/g.63360 Transcript_18042/m.63360 type:complete len:223 (+) Transcript_18042:1028-1696(+)
MDSRIPRTNTIPTTPAMIGFPMPTRLILTTILGTTILTAILTTMGSPTMMLRFRPALRPGLVVGRAPRMIGGARPRGRQGRGGSTMILATRPSLDESGEIQTKVGHPVALVGAHTLGTAAAGMQRPATRAVPADMERVPTARPITSGHGSMRLWQHRRRPGGRRQRPQKAPRQQEERPKRKMTTWPELWQPPRRILRRSRASWSWAFRSSSRAKPWRPAATT